MKFGMSGLGRGANGKSVQVGDVTLYFSYGKLIGFHSPETGTVVRENAWGSATGGHMAAIDGGTKAGGRRIPVEEFEARAAELFNGSKYV